VQIDLSKGNWIFVQWFYDKIGIPATFTAHGTRTSPVIFSRILSAMQKPGSDLRSTLFEVPAIGPASVTPKWFEKGVSFRWKSALFISFPNVGDTNVLVALASKFALV